MCYTSTTTIIPHPYASPNLPSLPPTSQVQTLQSSLARLDETNKDLLDELEHKQRALQLPVVPPELGPEPKVAPPAKPVLTCKNGDLPDSEVEKVERQVFAPCFNSWNPSTGILNEIRRTHSLLNDMPTTMEELMAMQPVSPPRVRGQTPGEM